MIKKSSLVKKLSSYSALASVFILTSRKADSQIIYNSIKPADTLFIYGSYFLDLDGDGISDFELAIGTYDFSFLYRLNHVNIYGQHGDSDIVEKDTVKSFQGFAQPNNYNNVIQVSDKWGTFVFLGSCSIVDFKNNGVFAGKGDKYIGLKFTRAEKNYYGWVRVNLNAKCDTLIIKDFAYNATPDSAIKAGDGEPTGISVLNSNVAVIDQCGPNPATSIFNIIYSIPVPGSVTICISDITGRKVETLLYSIMQSSGRHNIPVDVSNLSSGIYICSLIFNGQTVSQKITVAH